MFQLKFMEQTLSPLSAIMKELLSHRAIIAMLKELIANLQQEITIEQLIVLACIRENGIVSQQELAHLTVKDKSVIHRIVIGLNEKGLAG